MTPKEKAKELKELFTFNCRECDNSKISALIAVDEIMNVIIGSYDYELEKIYWQDVKNEIELL
jgi:hypothetical protein